MGGLYDEINNKLSKNERITNDDINKIIAEKFIREHPKPKSTKAKVVIGFILCIVILIMLSGFKISPRKIYYSGEVIFTKVDFKTRSNINIGNIEKLDLKLPKESIIVNGTRGENLNEPYTLSNIVLKRGSKNDYELSIETGYLILKVDTNGDSSLIEISMDSIFSKGGYPKKEFNGLATLGINFSDTITYIIEKFQEKDNRDNILDITDFSFQQKASNANYQEGTIISGFLKCDDINQKINLSKNDLLKFNFHSIEGKMIVHTNGTIKLVINKARTKELTVNGVNKIPSFIAYHYKSNEFNFISGLLLLLLGYLLNIKKFLDDKIGDCL